MREKWCTPLESLRLIKKRTSQVSRSNNRINISQSKSFSKKMKFSTKATFVLAMIGLGSVLADTDGEVTVITMCEGNEIGNK